MRRLIREPLFHFLLLGLGLFCLYAATGRGKRQAEPVSREIVVTQGRVRSLAETFARQWNRPPTREELDGLVAGFVREEVLMREAQALGLDRDDTIIRRRLAQKMEFLSEELTGTIEPGEDTLRAYLSAHPASFTEDFRVTFDQVFLDPIARGASLEHDAAALLRRLNDPGSSVDAGTLGDSRMLESRFENVTRRDVESQFGPDLAAALETATLGQWAGPIRSGLGAHLVRVETRVPGRVPAFESIRADVEREWSAAKRVELKEAQYRSLLERYQVTVEPSATHAVAATDSVKLP